MKSYPLYKKTGLSWIDEVPQEWKKVAIKFLASDKNSIFIDGDWIESNDITDSDDIRYITTGNVGVGRYIEKGNSFISEETFAKLRCKDVEPGDILISRLNLPIGRSCIAPNLGRRVVTSVDNVILRSDDGYDRRFLVYLFSDPDYLNNAENLARGTTMQRISRTQLGNIRVFVPESLKEQKSIADFLDRRLAPLDKLIFEKQNFINLLKEKRQALISHVVTKGLNPNVEMKDSGVEWIGEIPRHWDAKRIKHVAKVNPSTNRPEILPDESIGFVPMTNVNEKIGVIRKVDVRKYSEVSSGYTLFQNGDVIFAKITPCMENGNCAMIADMNYGIGFGSTEFIVFRPGKLIMQEYLHMVLRNNELRKICKRFMSGTAGQQRIATPFLENFPLALPPIEEQKAIVKEVGKKVKRLESLEDEVRKSIELLKEHRTALISAAVTGKIDLRNKEVA